MSNLYSINQFTQIKNLPAHSAKRANRSLTEPMDLLSYFYIDLDVVRRFIENLDQIDSNLYSINQFTELFICLFEYHEKIENRNSKSSVFEPTLVLNKMKIYQW